MRAVRNSSPVATAYATRADFCRIFTQEMKSLYLLSLLLTARQDCAEQCFVSSVGDSMDGKPVFKEWTYSWARRMVLQNAILMLRPEANNIEEGSRPHLSSLASEPNPVFRAVFRLNTFERFVFVMVVLDGYSEHECSVLLRSSKRDVVAAKAKAMHHLVATSEPTEFLRGRPQPERQFAAMDNKRRET